MDQHFQILVAAVLGLGGIRENFSRATCDDINMKKEEKPFEEF